jgi:RES domain-containing protein
LPLAIAWAGDVFRATGTGYANRRDLVTGEGSRRAGARWNAKGAFQALYGSLDLKTALDEVLAFHREQGLPDARALPLVFVALRVELQRILDLTQGRVRQTLTVSLKRMLEEPWRELQHTGREAVTHAIGRLARAAGFEALLVPSAVARQGRNLVLFPGQLLPGSHLEIVHAERLPAHRSDRPG